MQIGILKPMDEAIDCSWWADTNSIDTGPEFGKHIHGGVVRIELWGEFSSNFNFCNFFYRLRPYLTVSVSFSKRCRAKCLLNAEETFLQIVDSNHNHGLHTEENHQKQLLTAKFKAIKLKTEPNV